MKVKRGRASVARFFKHRKLRRGTVVEVSITARGYVGKVVRFTVRGNGKLPTIKQLCLPPGARSPRTCGR